MYKIVTNKSVDKSVKKLPKSSRRRVNEKIKSLGKDPRPKGSVQLSGQPKMFRIRVGNYRILYSVEDVIRIVRIKKVGHRKNVYRHFLL